MKPGARCFIFATGRGGLFRSVLTLLVSAMLLAACNPRSLPVPVSVPTPTPFLQVAPTPTWTPEPAPQPVTLRYALWDPLQEPAYAACAEQFMAAQPHITIVIEQTGWPEYWDKLAGDLAGGTAPDVFVNHLTRLPDLIAAGHLVDLESLMQRDGLDDTVYLGRLPRLWTRAGERFGLPKDWDTVALVYNRELLAAAGIGVEEINQLDWNPEDGGSLEQALARLTVDGAGANALSPAFDAEAVAVYGLTMADRDGGGAYGQQQWSYLAASNGFRFIDHLYATRYHYDDPALIETMAWYQRLINEQGYHTPFEQIALEDGRQLFLAGRAAMIADGSWTISQYANGAPFEVGFARLPVGPQGRRSMFNGLADSIWSGTQHPEAAWEWVKYLGSVDCQLTVGEHAVTFPALQSGVERMLAHYEARGIDVSAYTQQALEQDGAFLFPVTEHASQVIAIMQPVIEAILRGEADPAVALPEANQRVNALFKP
jgi:multiple sugar transport system substrate-binding protein